jgi:hypothetical protein
MLFALCPTSEVLTLPFVTSSAVNVSLQYLNFSHSRRHALMRPRRRRQTASLWEAYILRSVSLCMRIAQLFPVVTSTYATSLSRWGLVLLAVEELLLGSRSCTAQIMLRDEGTTALAGAVASTQASTSGSRDCDDAGYWLPGSALRRELHLTVTNLAIIRVIPRASA